MTKELMPNVSAITFPVITTPGLPWVTSQACVAWMSAPGMLGGFADVVLDPGARSGALLDRRALEADVRAGRLRDANGAWRALMSAIRVRNPGKEFRLPKRCRNIPAYRQIAALEIQTQYAYRVNLAFTILRILLRVYSLKVIWTAVYAGQGVVDGVALGQVIAFITLAQLQVWVMSPLVADYIRERVREGKIALDLARQGKEKDATEVFASLARQAGGGHATLARFEEAAIKALNLLILNSTGATQAEKNLINGWYAPSLAAAVLNKNYVPPSWNSQDNGDPNGLVHRAYRKIVGPTWPTN